MYTYIHMYILKNVANINNKLSGKKICIALQLVEHEQHITLKRFIIYSWKDGEHLLLVVICVTT